MDSLSKDKNQRFLIDFGALSPESVFRFFTARQVPEIAFNISSKDTENSLIEWLRKETTRFF
jgi:hypothetical protein